MQYIYKKSVDEEMIRREMQYTVQSKEAMDLAHACRESMAHLLLDLPREDELVCASGCVAD